MNRLLTDMQAVMEDSNVSMILLGADLTIRRFTRGMLMFFHLSPADVGRPIFAVQPLFDSPHLAGDIWQVLQQRGSMEREVRPGGTSDTYRMRIRRYCAADDLIHGVVLSVHCIGAEKAVAAASALRDINRNLAQNVGQRTRDLHAVMSSLGREMQERRKTERRLRELAERDRVTGLFNAAALPGRLAGALRDAQWWGKGIAVIAVDLDQFKPIIDLLGRAIADQVLIATARRLMSCLRGPDIAARIDGDGFVVVQADVQQRDDAGALCQRLLDMLGEPMEIGTHHIHVGASLGISLAPEHGTDPELLLRCSGLALSEAKRAGGRAWRFFRPELTSRRRAEAAVEADLRTALVQGSFEVLYQPQVLLDAGSTVGFEALVRWRRPAGDVVMPDGFIRVAEQTGQILPIGAFVLRRACRDAAAWPSPLTVAVNLSPVQLRDQRLVEQVAEVLAETGLPPARLELEVTETVLLSDNEATLRTLRALRGLGVRIAMDDFGTGYSSLGFLRSFPFDRIKIDRSFVGALGKAFSADTLVGAILGLARGLGMSVTAEGVETEQQLRVLRSLGCAEGQGYLFGGPAEQASIVSSRPMLAAAAPRVQSR